MLKAYAALWKNCFNYKGKTDRRGFRLAAAPQLVLMLALVLLVAPKLDDSRVLPALLFSWGIIIMLLPLISLNVRRLRDAGKSPANAFWLCLPYIGWVILIIKVCGKSVPEETVREEAPSIPEPVSEPGPVRTPEPVKQPEEEKPAGNAEIRMRLNGEELRLLHAALDFATAGHPEIGGNVETLKMIAGLDKPIAPQLLDIYINAVRYTDSLMRAKMNLGMSGYAGLLQKLTALRK